MGKSKSSDITLYEKSSKEIKSQDNCDKLIDAYGCPKGCHNIESCIHGKTEQVTESSEDSYDRKVIGWMLLLPLIGRILVGISWTTYWQIIMDVSFVIMFIIGLCIMFYRGKRT